MTHPILYGPGYSTYVRSCRLALAEKGVRYQFEEFDFFQGMPADEVPKDAQALADHLLIRAVNDAQAEMSPRSLDEQLLQWER